MKEAGKQNSGSIVGVAGKYQHRYQGGRAIDPENSGWAYDVISYTPMTLMFSKDFIENKLDLKFNLVEHGKILLEIFENKSSTATRTKYISW